MRILVVHNTIQHDKVNYKSTLSFLTVSHFDGAKANHYMFNVTTYHRVYIAISVKFLCSTFLCLTI